MLFKSTLSQVFNCKNCDSDAKKKRGCLRPFKKKQVWQIDECVFCFGENSKCSYCHGRGRISVHQCPRVVNGDSFLLSYFIAYKNSGCIAWPDGGGRLFQPTKLVTAFDVLSFYFDKLEAVEMEKVKNNVGKN